MFRRKVGFSWLGVISTMFLINVTFASNNLLVKIELQTRDDYQRASELDIKAYFRVDKGYLAEVQRERIEKVENLDISFLILDEISGIQDYFLVSKELFRTKADLSAYGQILLEEGNFTLLKTDRSKALDLLQAGYRINKITTRTIPLKYVAPPSPSIPALSYSKDLDSLLDQISADSLTSYISKLQSFQTRFVFSDSIVKARHWLLDKFKSFGIDSVYLYPFEGSDAYGLGYWVVDSNVVAVIPGTTNPDKVIVVGSHYDSVVWPFDPSNFNQPAPGADDNASGTAAILEFARILVNHPLKKTVILIPFSAEELGLVGSYAYAFGAYYSGMDIQLMLNLDMIGYYESQKNIIVHRPGYSIPYGLAMADLAGLYTDLNVYLQSDAASDNLPFSQVGYNTLFSIEYIFNVYYHTPSESLTYLDVDYMREVAKMNLATLAEVAESPGPVKGLQVMDAGDGERLYLNWSSLNESDLTGYRIYYGTQSGIYTDTQTVSPGFTSDTLRGLQNEVVYYIAVSGINSSGKESIYRSEITGIPRVIPKSPSGLTAQTGYFRISLSWQSNLEADLSHYNIYRSTVSGSGYDSIATGIKGLTYVDSTVQGGIWYYYCIAAVDTSGNQSSYSDEVRMIAITLDQGVLVIDESANSRGNPPSPSSDVQQDSFYSELFSGYRTGFYEYTYITDYPTMTDLGPYSTVVWLDDDYFKSNFADNKDYELIKEYLGYGGKFIMISWTGIRYFGTLPCNFYPGSFVYDYLHISWARDNSLNDFAGAFSYDPVLYPELKVDTLKWLSSIDNRGRLKYGNIFNIRGGAEPLYYFDSYTDDTVYEGKVCGLKYIGTDYKLAFFGFPLYYLEEEGAKGLVASLMRDFDEPLAVDENPAGNIPERFTLSQNYPNPFNPSTRILFRVGSLGFGEPIRTSLKIYNILGQLVRTLVDEDKLPGRYNIIWDGKDDSGKEAGSGIYFYQLRTKDYTTARKMVLLR